MLHARLIMSTAYNAPATDTRKFKAGTEILVNVPTSINGLTRRPDEVADYYKAFSSRSALLTLETFRQRALARYIA